VGLVVTIANRKGGVGKTTLALALAETFVYEHKKDTVILDLDPQSSATEILLSDDEYSDRLLSGMVLPGFLRLKMQDQNADSARLLSLAKHCFAGRADIELAISPNSPELWDLEYEVLRNGQERQYRESVRGLIDALAEAFDTVVVDTPPGKMIAAEEAILSSNVVICPIVPERLSIWGMDKMIEYFRCTAEPARKCPAMALCCLAIHEQHRRRTKSDRDDSKHLSRSLPARQPRLPWTGRHGIDRPSTVTNSGDENRSVQR
jgi:chromosome partitioning protein